MGPRSDGAGPVEHRTRRRGRGLTRQVLQTRRELGRGTSAREVAWEVGGGSLLRFIPLPAGGLLGK